MRLCVPLDHLQKSFLIASLSPRDYQYYQQKKFPCDRQAAEHQAQHQDIGRITCLSIPWNQIDHGSIGLRHAGLIDFESRNTARVTAASTFVLQTDELLKEAKPNYEKAFHGVDGQLHRLKGIIDGIEPHDPKPVSF
jgi:hypothetical protein